MVRQASLTLARMVVTTALALLLGCSASDIRINPPEEATTGTVAVTVVRSDNGEPIGVEAVVIIGGERATLPAGDETVRIPNVPFGKVQSPNQPVQPLTVTARGFVTSLEQATLNVSGETQVTVELDEADLDTTGTVEGLVTDSDNDDPVGNVTVQFRPDIPGTSVLVEGATDKNGRYIIGGIPTGNVVAGVSAQGFLSATQKVIVIQDSGGSGNPEVDFRLVPTSSKASVKGRVIDLISRQPIKGATVDIGGRPSVTTRADGSFEVTEVPVGDQFIAVTASGYDPFSSTVYVGPSMAGLQIELAPTQAGPPGGPATIMGTVTVRNRSDNSGVTVRAVLVSTSQVMATTVTDASGDYGLFVPPGRYRIEVSYQSVHISKTVTLLGAGRVLTGVDFQITAP